MNDGLILRFGGYGPPTTTHSRGLKAIGDHLERSMPGRVEVRYVWNVMDLGYRTHDLLWLTECGILDLCYMSTAALTRRVPQLGFADLPFLFADIEEARAAYDGMLGAHLSALTEAACGFRVLGYFENGFRHLSSRLRPVRRPEDLAGQKIRTLTSDVHGRTFEALGARPSPMDLNEALKVIAAGEVDAQENPFANTVTYGVHQYHRFHTQMGHFYLSRGLYANRAAHDRLPGDVRAALASAVALAVSLQRDLAVAEEDIARQTIAAAGCDIHEPDEDERTAFRDAVRPVWDEARARFGPAMFEMLTPGRT